MIIRLRDGDCIDGFSIRPKRDLFLVDGLVRHQISPDAKVDATYDLNDHWVMPGGIDLHTHIGGGKVNLARMLLPELRRSSVSAGVDAHGIVPLSHPVPGAWETGRRYIEMGYTTCIEPAVLPANARHAHCEMADIPWLDTGGYLLLGNDRMLLRWLSDNAPQQQITDYVGWMLTAHRCCGIKVVNAGGIDAFKFNQRHLDVDESHPHYPITPRRILKSLAQAVEDLNLAHPLHVHCSNLGVPGNIQSTLATLDAVEGRRVHLTHAQYHCYGNTGPHGFNSEAYQLAEYVNWNPNVTIDVGQIHFSQTVTISGDTMHQFENRKFARPRKVIFQDLECQAGCGIVPFRYREDQYVHGLQWTIGLELFLRILDSSRVFLTTDHPNGGPFTSYPHLIHLLMSYDFRMSIFDRLHPKVKEVSPLPTLKREYTLEEIVRMTRSGPASILGLPSRGVLSDGADADVVAYPKRANIGHMFARPSHVFKNGMLIYKDGEYLRGTTKTSMISLPEFDTGIEKRFKTDWPEQYGYHFDLIRIRDEELVSGSRRINVTQSRTSHL
jgi:formylmethanofuran dehydrogenase subunit A